MPQLNFSAQFAEAVADGTKRQTIRATRKVPIKLDDTLHLFTGLRTKQARRLRGPEICTAALLIGIRWKVLKNSKYQSLEVKLQHKGKLKAAEVWDLMKADGFTSREDFAAWFLPKGVGEFKGQLIKW